MLDSLLRKPGGIRNYRYREGLFPQLIFRQAWEQLNSYLPPRKADLTYLRVFQGPDGTIQNERNMAAIPIWGTLTTFRPSDRDKNGAYVPVYECGCAVG